jgi:hypothetical protein
MLHLLVDEGAKLTTCGKLMERPQGGGYSIIAATSLPNCLLSTHKEGFSSDGSIDLQSCTSLLTAFTEQ